MKAARFHQHGGPEVLRYEDAPEPKLDPGEILVRVKACALNHLDIWVRQGRCPISAGATSPVWWSVSGARGRA